MDYTLSYIMNDDMPTKQRIMICALDQFNKKGYSETTIRDIAKAVGITSGSIYGHFSSKEEILQYMLNDYAEYTSNMFHSMDITPVLQKNPTGEGISLCIMSSISILTENVYYANLVHLIHQEQHRNPLFGGYILIRLKDTQEFIERIFDELKGMNIIRPDADAEYWGLIAFGVLHTIPTLHALNTRQNAPGYTMKDLAPILRHMFDMILDLYKLSNEE